MVCIIWSVVMGNRAPASIGAAVVAKIVFDLILYPSRVGILISLVQDFAWLHNLGTISKIFENLLTITISSGVE